MMETGEFLTHTRIEAHVLEAWIDYGWLLPRRDVDVHHFSELDLARAQLIRDLQENMGVNGEGVSIILDLVDQIHGLRRTLRKVLSSTAAPSETPAPAGTDHSPEST
jgi:chaperone modulatory protein CbpM